MNFTVRELVAKTITEDNITYFNHNRRNGKLSVKYYVDDGNKADVYKDDIKILACVPVETASGAVVAIINYERKE